jgi:hypothetical protein
VVFGARADFFFFGTGGIVIVGGGEEEEEEEEGGREEGEEDGGEEDGGEEKGRIVTFRWSFTGPNTVAGEAKEKTGTISFVIAFLITISWHPSMCLLTMVFA